MLEESILLQFADYLESRILCCDAVKRLYAEWLKEQDSVPLCDRWEEAEKFIAQGGKALEPPATCDRPERVYRADTLCL